MRMVCLIMSSAARGRVSVLELSRRLIVTVALQVDSIFEGLVPV
jgi:hypothetical protein